MHEARLRAAMHAHRIRVRVSSDRELRLTLPDDFPPGDVDVIVVEAASGTRAHAPRRLSVDEFLQGRLTPPPGVGPVSLEDMESAIASGMTGRGSF